MQDKKGVKKTMEMWGLRREMDKDRETWRNSIYVMNAISPRLILGMNDL